MDLAPFGEDVPDAVKELVASEKERILSGVWDVFTGPIKNREGESKVPGGRSLSDEEILSMNWFVEGVEGTLPQSQ